MAIDPRDGALYVAWSDSRNGDLDVFVRRSDDQGKSWTGPVRVDSDDGTPALMSGALALAFPSLYEGFGLPALEAMACGTPVLASSTSSLPEVVGDAGLLIDPLDVDAIAGGLERLARDTELRRALAERGLARAAGFTWEQAARETLKILEKAAGTSGRLC
jgi:glycosyltransferase involved in cell wall biosynthesis